MSCQKKWCTSIVNLYVHGHVVIRLEYGIQYFSTPVSCLVIIYSPQFLSHDRIVE